MKKLFLLFLFPAFSFAAESLETPNDCSWWLKKLSDISLFEGMRDQETMDRILAEEGYQAALEFEMTTRERIREVMKEIEKANARLP